MIHVHFPALEQDHGFHDNVAYFWHHVSVESVTSFWQINKDTQK